MANQDLVNYISDALRKGYSDAFLRQSLIQQGWPMGEISEAFSVAKSGQAGQPFQVAQSAQAMQAVKQKPVSSRNKMKLRRVGVFSSAKISAVVSAIIGIVFAIMFMIPVLMLGSAMPDLSALGTLTGADPFGLLALFGALGILMAVLIPVGFAISGFIGGALFAVFYNLVAGALGGYEVEFEE